MLLERVVLVLSAAPIQTLLQSHHCTLMFVTGGKDFCRWAKGILKPASSQDQLPLIARETLIFLAQSPWPLKDRDARHHCLPVRGQTGCPSWISQGFSAYSCISSARGDKRMQSEILWNTLERQAQTFFTGA